MNDAPTEPGFGPTVIDVFEEYVRSRDQATPPPARTFEERLPDEESKRSFLELVESYGWTEDLLPRNVQPNVVLARRFRLIDRLGVGGMGQVWRAEDLKIGKQVAVKVMSLVGGGAIDSENAFERETRLLAQLNHPGIVSVIDADQDEEHRFIVMELVEGRSLQEVLDRIRDAVVDRPGIKDRGAADILAAIGLEPESGHAPLLDDEDWADAVATVMVRILYTLEAAHSRLVVHRDLKPGNLMLGAGGEPVLLDFGLGGRIGGGSGDLTDRLFGTFRFVAPEQLSRGRVGADVRTDVYQLGVVLYEFLTLQKCFATEDHVELFDRISKGAFTQPRAVDRNIPRDLEDVVLRAMDVDPVRRYQSAVEFREALQRYLRREPVHLERSGPLWRFVRRARYAARQHRPLMVAAAAVVFGGILTWLAQDLLTPAVRVQLLPIQKGAERSFDIEVQEEQVLLAVLRFEDQGSSRVLYRPTRFVGTRSGTGTAAEAQSHLFLKPGESQRVRAVVPEAVRRAVQDEERIEVLYTLSPLNLFGRVLQVFERMEERVGTGASGVDDEWMQRHWDPVTRSADKTQGRIPREMYRASGAWSQGRFRGQALRFTKN